MPKVLDAKFVNKNKRPFAPSRQRSAVFCLHFGWTCSPRPRLKRERSKAVLADAASSRIATVALFGVSGLGFGPFGFGDGNESEVRLV